jgi:hypothetical protein
MLNIGDKIIYDIVRVSTYKHDKIRKVTSFSGVVLNVFGGTCEVRLTNGNNTKTLTVLKTKLRLQDEQL